MAVGQIWQAALGIGPINEAWRDMVTGSHLFPSNTHDDLAFETARNAIGLHYLIGAGVPGVHERARKALKELPFIHGPQSSEVSDKLACDSKLRFSDMTLKGSPNRDSPHGDIFGDEVLKLVVSTVLFGKGKGRTSATAPINGIGVDDVTKAAVMVRQSSLLNIGTGS